MNIVPGQRLRLALSYYPTMWRHHPLGLHHDAAFGVQAGGSRCFTPPQAMRLQLLTTDGCWRIHPFLMEYLKTSYLLLRLIGWPVLKQGDDVNINVP